jgi:hypothetical protein
MQNSNSNIPNNLLLDSFFGKNRPFEQNMEYDKKHKPTIHHICPNRWNPLRENDHTNGTDALFPPHSDPIWKVKG